MTENVGSTKRCNARDAFGSPSQSKNAALNMYDTCELRRSPIRSEPKNERGEDRFLISPAREMD
jgi:hypothetical protein